MDDQKTAAAKKCLAGAENNTMTFPEVVRTLAEGGFESYAIDFRRTAATYYLPDGDYVELHAHEIDTPVAPAFNAPLLQDAIHEAQAMVEGYTYNGFCNKAAAAGVAGYMVSLSGRRAVYFGRTAETHVEYFPGVKI